MPDPPVERPAAALPKRASGLATTSAGDDDVALEALNAANRRLTHAAPPDGEGFPIVMRGRDLRKMRPPLSDTLPPGQFFRRPSPPEAA